VPPAPPGWTYRPGGAPGQSPWTVTQGRGAAPTPPPAGPPARPPGPAAPGWPPPQQGVRVPLGPFYPPTPQQPVVAVRRAPTARSWLAVVVACTLLAALVGGTVGYLVARHSQQTIVEEFSPNSPAFAKPADVQAVLAKVEPAVVSIATTGVRRGVGEVEGAGTGMILTDDGQVLTNDHVVAGASSVTVTLFGQSNPLAAKVIGTDPAQDLALIQIEGQHGLPTVELGDSDRALVGDNVLAIGNALALSGGLTVTEGIVSSKDRSLTTTNDVTGRAENLSGLLQTDAAINSGNSGGPLVNSLGQVIGMNTAVAESTQGNAPAQNIGFAIAIDTIKPLLPMLRAGGLKD
jgi:serine protease Do